jgi:hypothetical protein
MPRLVICTKTLTQRRIARRRRQVSVAPKPELFGDDFHLEMSLAGAVEFAKEDTLPAPQLQLAVFHKNRLACSHQHGLHVRIRISFGVPVRPFKGDQAVKRAFEITGHIGVGTLVDRDCGGSVRHVHIANTVGHTRFLNHLLHLCGHVNKLRATSRFYF